MCKAMEEMITEEKIQIACQMIEMRLGTLEQIAKATGLSYQKVEELAHPVTGHE